MRYSIPAAAACLALLAGCSTANDAEEMLRPKHQYAPVLPYENGEMVTEVFHKTPDRARRRAVQTAEVECQKRDQTWQVIKIEDLSGHRKGDYSTKITFRCVTSSPSP